MKIISKSKLLHALTVLILISLSITGSECDKVLSDNGNVPGILLGDWQLASQTGALQDICPQERVNYQSSFIAQLTCPGSTPITRDFEIENDVLTYTQTSISYDVEFSENDTKLALYGKNVSRNLFYEKVITSVNPPAPEEKTEFNNSSEIRR